MNPRLVKFVVELQNQDAEVKTKKELDFNKNFANFFNFSKLAKVTLPIDKK